jgi:predicted amino acid dehydrogenase
MIPTPNGEVFGCMAETVTVGLLNYAGDFSYGPLSKIKVLESLVMAKEVGIELGSLKKMEGF